MKNLKEAVFRVIAESGTPLSFKIVIIEEGLSKNGTYYPKETLLKSRQLFEGAKICYYKFNEFYDHLSEDARLSIPAGFPGNVAGIVTDVKLEKLDSGKYGLVGILKLTESNKWLADIFKLGLQNDMKEVLGFSIDVYGESLKETIDGKEVDKVVSIDQVNEITVVTNPAAGGRLERMVASVNSQYKEKTVMKEKIVKLLMSLRPQKLEGISIFESTEESLKKLFAESVAEIKTEFKESADLLAALDAFVMAVEKGDMEAAKAAAMKAKELYASASASATTESKGEEVKAGEEAPKGDATVIDIKTKQEAMAKRLEESEKKICESTLRAHLAESKLPDAAKDRIKERFIGKVFVESELKKEIETELKYASKLAESLHPGGLKISVGADSSDKLGDAIEGMLKGADVNKIPRFKSIHEAYCKTENVTPFSSGFKDNLWATVVRSVRANSSMKEAVSSSGFGEILGDRLRKRMIAEYSEAGLQDWRKICTIGNPKDFYTNRVVKMGGYGTNMATVNEAAAYAALTSPTDEEATYAVTKRGGIESISMESIKNDNLGALQMIPKRLGRGCANTLYQFVFEFINPATNPTIYDAAALYVAGHGSNLRTVALSYAEFNNIFVTMGDMTGYNEANFFPDNKPKYLVVPNELWLTATEIAKANVSSSGARTETLDNAYSEFDLEVIRVPYWTDSNNYVTMADPKKIAGLEIGFLDGNEEPELLQEAANSGSDFTNDQIRYKVRHIYGGAIVDWRPFVGSVVA